MFSAPGFHMSGLAAAFLSIALGLTIPGASLFAWATPSDASSQPLITRESSNTVTTAWAQKFNPQWTSIEAQQPPFDGDELHKFNEYLTFEQRGDFNMDGVLDVAFTATYKHGNGTSGLFFAIVDGVSRLPIFVVPLKTPAPFIAIGKNDGDITLWTCVSCDLWTAVVFDKNSLSFSLVNPTLHH